MIKKIAAMVLTVTAFTFNAQAGLMDEYGVMAYSNGSHNGGKGSTSAAITSGSTTLLGELQTNSYLPTLKAITTNGYGRLVSIQAFQYTGNSSLDLDLFINLHGSSSGSGYDNGIRADIGIIDAGSSLEGYEDYYFGYDFATIFYEPSEGYGVDNTSLYINNEQDVNKQDTLNISLISNQYFYVVTQLTVKASNGGISDAWNTLGMSFSDNSNLLSAVPSTTSVPEPTTWALLCLSVLGFAARKSKIK
jgi:hypothetical protein